MRARSWVGGLLVLSLTSCESLAPRARRRVQLSPELASLYWSETQRRTSAWFENGGVEPPELPPSETVYSKVAFFEVPREDLATCTFDNGDLEIEVGDDKWQDGCVPHELGHAALWLIGHLCWDEFEHPGERPDRCR